MKRLMTLLAITALSAPLFAAEAQGSGNAAAAKKTENVAKGSKAAKKSNSSDVNISQGIDIIGSQDAPLELNIVPWKEKEAYLPKNALEASVLNETLDPIDRDVVRREVDFSRALQKSPSP